MAGRVGRPIFRKSDVFVAVRPIKLTSKKMLKPGTKLPKGKFRLHHLKSLYTRRRIGPKGHPWTEAMLASTGFPKLNPTAEAVKDALASTVAVALTPAGAPDSFELHGETVQVDEVLELAVLSSELDAKAWNALEDETKGEHMTKVVELMADLGEEEVDETDEAKKKAEKAAKREAAAAKKKAAEASETDDFLDD